MSWQDIGILSGAASVSHMTIDMSRLSLITGFVDKSNTTGVTSEV